MNKLLDLLCGLLSGIALFAIMALTFFDVLGRKFASHSITGSLELTELLMVVVIFAGLPLVSLQGEHVVFDSLDAWLPAAWRRVQAVVIDALCALALAGVAVLLWTKAGQMAQYGDTTAQLKIPQAPFVYLMSLLCGLTALVHALLVVQPEPPHPPGLEGGAE